MVEDYVRFGLDDLHLTEQPKTFDTSMPRSLLLEGRLLASTRSLMSASTITTDSEGHRPDMGSVAVASLKRIGEALRSLEEFR